MSKTKLLFFCKENTGGTIGFFSKIYPDLQNYFNLQFFFFKKVDEGFVIQNSKFLSRTYTSDTSLTVKKFTQTYRNLIKIIRLMSSLEDGERIVVLDIYAYVLVCFCMVLMRKKNRMVYIVENNIPEVLKNNRSLTYRVLLRLAYKLLISRISDFVFTCKALSRDFTKKYNIKASRINIIPLGVDIKKTAMFKHKIPQVEARLFDGVVGLVTVMNFTPQKDVKTLLEAFARVQKNYPKLRLFVLGSGYAHAGLEEKVEKLGIKDKVHFLGWKKDVMPYLRKSKIFVFSSKYEGFGLVILEAMAIGLPVISSDTKYGPPDILENQKYGLLYPIGKVKKLSEQIQLLLGNPKLAKEYSSLSIERSLEYDMPKIVEKYKNFFLSIV